MGENKTPFFTVILPTYNRGDYLSVPIKSVLAQTFEDFELIIIDDGSTDNTRAVIKSFSDARVTYLFQENKERSAARNLGIANSTGRYICFLDSDDYCLPNHLDSFYKKIKECGFPEAMFYCNTLEDRNGELVKSPPPQYATENELEFVLLNIIGVPRACIHREILNRHKFNEETNIGEDVDLWVRILQEYPLIYNNEFTTVFRSHGDRSVELSKEYPFLQNLKIKKKILKNLKGKISNSVKSKVLSDCYFNLARHYGHTGKKVKMQKTLIKSLLTGPFNRPKETIYLLLKSTGLYK